MGRKLKIPIIRRRPCSKVCAKCRGMTFTIGKIENEQRMGRMDEMYYTYLELEIEEMVSSLHILFSNSDRRTIGLKRPDYEYNNTDRLNRARDYASI